MLAPNAPTESAYLEPKKPEVVVSEEFEKLGTLVKQSLVAFRGLVEDFSMKQLARIAVSVVESPLENTQYRVDSEGLEVFVNEKEEEAVKLARAIKFWQFQMFLENMKNPEKVEAVQELVNQFERDNSLKEVNEVTV